MLLLSSQSVALGAEVVDLVEHLLSSASAEVVGKSSR
jgi:hypothetical protein